MSTSLSSNHTDRPRGDRVRKRQGDRQGDECRALVVHGVDVGKSGKVVRSRGMNQKTRTRKPLTRTLASDEHPLDDASVTTLTLTCPITCGDSTCTASARNGYMEKKSGRFGFLSTTIMLFTTFLVAVFFSWQVSAQVVSEPTFFFLQNLAPF